MLKTLSGLFRAFTPSLVEGQSRKVKGRSWAFKLSTLLVTVFLLHSFLLPSFCFGDWHYPTRELDENGLPGVQGNFKYIVVLQSGYGFFMIPIFVKLVGTSAKATSEKKSSTPRKNGPVAE